MSEQFSQYFQRYAFLIADFCPEFLLPIKLTSPFSGAGHEDASLMDAGQTSPLKTHNSQM